MKIPQSLKLPRKLKKELKKRFTRNYHNSGPFIDNDTCKVTMYTKVTYSGSNTKSFFRLCKYVRKVEKQNLERWYNEYIVDFSRPLKIPEFIVEKIHSVLKN